MGIQKAIRGQSPAGIDLGAFVATLSDRFLAEMMIMPAIRNGSSELTVLQIEAKSRTAEPKTARTPSSYFFSAPDSGVDFRAVARGMTDRELGEARQMPWQEGAKEIAVLDGEVQRRNPVLRLAKG